MINVVGIRFKPAGKIYYFDPKRISLRRGDDVIVETARGIEYGRVVIATKKVDEKEIVAPLKPVIRKADEEDKKINEDNKYRAKDAMDICRQKILDHGMEMKLVECEYTFDNNKVIFYFTAEGRVDFRALVKDLAAIFRMRIELRQIGVRDQAKALGGVGQCGQVCCCHRYMGDFAPVSIKMAKEQELSLNPAKISGICGRLMCCINYEHKIYEENLRKLPAVGSQIQTKDGKAVVTEVMTLLRRMKARVTLADETDEIREYALEDVTLLEKPGVGKSRRRRRDRKPGGGQASEKAKRR